MVTAVIQLLDADDVDHLPRLRVIVLMVQVFLELEVKLLLGLAFFRTEPDSVNDVGHRPAPCLKFCPASQAMWVTAW
jgi:hypothetical protein